jgi:DnaJ-class molecular chaperone with C-terminal Zn finger domain
MIRLCHICHGKGKETIITRLTFGPASEMDTMERVCPTCNGEGKLYVVPASQAPVEEVK